MSWPSGYNCSGDRTPSTSTPSPPRPRASTCGRGVVGQAAAVAELRAAARAPVHAYLLVGPRGSGKRALARAFAAALLSADRDGDDAVRHAELALAEAHPDLTVVERRGASITVEQADDIIAAASRASVEGGAKVLVLDEFHLVTTPAPSS